MSEKNHHHEEAPVETQGTQAPQQAEENKSVEVGVKIWRDKDKKRQNEYEDPNDQYRLHKVDVSRVIDNPKEGPLTIETKNGQTISLSRESAVALGLIKE